MDKIPLFRDSLTVACASFMVHAALIVNELPLSSFFTKLIELLTTPPQDINIVAFCAILVNLMLNIFSYCTTLHFLISHSPLADCSRVSIILWSVQCVLQQSGLPNIQIFQYYMTLLLALLVNKIFVLQKGMVHGTIL